MATGRRPDSRSSRSRRRSTSTATSSAGGSVRRRVPAARPADRRTRDRRLPEGPSHVPAAHAVQARRKLPLQGDPGAAASGAPEEPAPQPSPNAGPIRTRIRIPTAIRGIPTTTATRPARIPIASRRRPANPAGRCRRPIVRAIRAPDSGTFGTLNIRVQPGDAVGDHDGERWDSPEGGSRLASSSRRDAPHRSAEGRLQAVHVHRSDPPRETQALNISLPPGGN